MRHAVRVAMRDASKKLQEEIARQILVHRIHATIDHLVEELATIGQLHEYVVQVLLW